MRQYLALFAAVVLAGLVRPASASAQQRDSAAVVQIETTDGNTYIGTVLYEDSTVLRLKTDRLGELTLQKSDISKITSVNAAKIANGVYWSDNPQSTRYFWSPDGYGLRAGEGYYQDVWVLFNQVSVGVSDHFSIGAGLVPLFLFGGTATPVWITPKFSIPIKENELNVGVGGLFGTVLGQSNAAFGIAYGVTTVGSRDKNVTFGLGYGFSGGKWASTPLVTLSAMIRTGPHGYFITENYYINTGSDPVLLFSIGGRRIIKRVGLDFGLFIPVVHNQSTVIAIPWLGLTLPFGNVGSR